MKFDILHRGKLIETKEFSDGSYKIGRTSDCDIYLKSSQISKQHALLVIKGNQAAIVDLGSVNGVFVNGIMVRKQRFNKNDEVAIAEFKICFSTGKRKKESQPAQSPAPSSEIELDTPMAGGFDGNLAIDASPGPMAMEDSPSEAQMNPQDKLLFLMDQKVLAPFYSLMKSVDWRVITAAILTVSLLGTVAFSVYSLLDWGQGIATAEALKRAHTILSQSVRENYRILSETNDYTRLTIKTVEDERGILKAIIIDPDTKSVLAPASQMRMPVRDVHEQIALERIVRNKEEVVSVDKTDGVYVVAQPIFLFNQKRNTRKLKAIVMARFEVPSGIFATYDRILLAILFAVLFALVAFYLISKMVSYPIVKMQEQLDSALKGDDVSITCEAKFPELDTLATVINFSVSRWKQSEAQSAAQVEEPDDIEAEMASHVATVKEFDEGTSDGLLLIDRDKKIFFIGNVLEELLSIKSQYAEGQNVSEAFKEASFSGTVIDLADRVITNFGETQFGAVDVNGISRNFVATSHKMKGGDIGFILITVKMASE